MKLLSPVFFKEMKQAATSRRLVVIMACLFAALLLDFLAVALTYKGQYELTSGELGYTLFVTLSTIELIAIVIFSPIITAGVVSGEKEANTLGLLFLTRLKPINIVQDKGLSRIAFLVFLCVVTFPFMSAAMLFGGVAPGHIAVISTAILSVIIAIGGMNLYCSAVARSTGAAIAASYGMSFAYLILVPVVTLIFSSGSAAEELLRHISPVYLFGETMSYARSAGRSFDPLLPALCNFGLSIALYTLFVMRGARKVRDHVCAEPQVKTSFFRRLRQKYTGLILQIPVRLLDRAPVIKGNCVTWKESNLRNHSMKTSMIILGDTLFVTYLIILTISSMLQNVFHHEETHIVGHAFAWVFYALFLGILAANSFSREKASGAFDVLLTTRLSGLDIIRGTFWGNARFAAVCTVPLLTILAIGAVASSSTAVSWPLLSIVAYALFLIAVGVFVSFKYRFAAQGAGFLILALCLLFFDDSSVKILAPILNIVVFSSFIIAVGMYASLRLRTAAQAASWTMGIILFLTLGLLVLGLYVDEGLRARDLGKLIFAVGPSYWIADGPDHRAYDSGFGGTAGYVAVLTTYAMASFIILVKTVKSFNRIVGRQGD